MTFLTCTHCLEQAIFLATLTLTILRLNLPPFTRTKRYLYVDSLSVTSLPSRLRISASQLPSVAAMPAMASASRGSCFGAPAALPNSVFASEATRSLPERPSGDSAAAVETMAVASDRAAMRAAATDRALKIE